MPDIPIVSLYSYDSVKRDTPNNYLGLDTDALHGMRDSGMPPHQLNLKIGMPLILLKNYDLEKGLSNGTKLVVTDFLGETRINRLKCKIVSGPNAGQTIELSRINSAADDTNFVHWTRMQFPVVPAFAMTISKSQGQTLSRVAVSLQTHCFSRGQLYVVASRVDDPANIKFWMPPIDGRLITSNIIFRAILPLD